jgi:hypothetical protein
VATAVVLLGILFAAVPALAHAAARSITFAGIRVAVPAGWSVYDLQHAPATCVRLDRHAIYLGRPGTHQRCPAHAAGRTESILVEPVAVTQRLNPGRSDTLRLVRLSRRAAVYASWRGHPGVIERALGQRTLQASVPAPRLTRAVMAGATSSPQPTSGGASPGTSGGAGGAGSSPSASPPTTPGAVFTGRGFDACSAPSAAQLNAWAASPYRALGIYIGGTNMACAQTNLTPAWVNQEAAAGWHMIPTYVGLQAPSNSCGCAAITSASAAGQGASAAADAINEAQSLGLGPGNPIYYDMEAYARPRDSATVLKFLSAWTSALHADGYKSGVYSSEASGIDDLVSQWGTSYPEPDELWVANWNGAQSTADANVPAGDWASHQRVHQYQGSHNETYGATTLNIDGDYLDAATAGPGSATPPPPTLGVSPAPDGSIVLTPSWRGGPAVARWQLLGGAAPGALATAAAATAARPIVVHSAFPYFAVQALNAAGVVIGTSAPVATPSHLALAGTDAFVAGQGVGAVPVQCFRPSPCHVSATIRSSQGTVVTTGSEYVPVGGGLVLFTLPARTHRQLSARRRLAVSITVRDRSGLSATRPMVLAAFRTSGRSPARTSAPAPSLSVLGLTDYVSAGWVGGILSSCRATTPCHVMTTITAGRTVLARTGGEFLGAGEVGYLVFTLTPAGHALLAHAHGNQLAARVTEVNGRDRASAVVGLISF